MTLSRSKAKISSIPTFSRLVILSLVLLVTACAHTRLPQVPPFASDGQKHPGKIVWHDLVTPDMTLAKSFYTHLFGWRYEDVSDGYALIKHNGHLIGGIAELNRRDKTAYWLPQMSVPNLDRAVKYTKEQQGTIMIKAFELPGRGRIAVIKDPQGAIFSMVESVNGDPPDEKAKLNDWLWDEVWTHDLTGTEKFYQGLIDYQLETKTKQGADYRYLSFHDKPRVGLIQLENQELSNTWATYIKVENVMDTTDKAKALRGNILLAPNADIRHGSVAIITDPSGAGLVIQEWKK